MAAYLKMAAMWKVTCVVFSFFAIFAVLVDGGNKYSKEKNKMQNKKEMENPYRMQKLNLVWQKGKRVSKIATWDVPRGGGRMSPGTGGYWSPPQPRYLPDSNPRVIIHN